MEEETDQPFFFRGRWRGQKLWILICASLLAGALVFMLVWINPSSENGRGRASPAGRETSQPEAAAGSAEDPMQDAKGGQPQEPAAQEDGQQPPATPGAGGSAPGIVVEFPEPAGMIPAEPPPGGYGDVLGHWVLNMSGSDYGLTNCHVVMNEDGTISSPPDYDQVFLITGSAYTWREGSSGFSASLRVTLKLNGGQAAIPVEIELAGNVAESLLEITGSFTASPPGEAYGPYAQRGGFAMHR
ncbi:MAG: hypothetical protein PHP28_01155 [Actinomycetota bacterium]|nr:hypothetical protein [Actinomycetota bacterium]